ncbi:bacitracin export ATP-binding protein BceA [mine drainage metagenome]|uniref:Bacitracin export ATP-binding protein BceA n=1 Tax=mine drainage metagenome TaxID=410659 RepID=A0A1J5Q4R0_9ZZZZ
MVADEPTGALDRATGHDMMRVLTESTRAAGTTLVVVTHDPEIARWCSRTILMQDGRITTLAATR